ncbi:MAG TPA: PKD domain-containing protein, partial [Planctomycetota bacterium]|nr:PKD domain-containing protein [Planctomycetota bacterium]
MQPFASLFAVLALAATATAQLSLVTPNGYASTVGNTNNTFPWARGTASMRIQFLIDSTHFTSQGVASPIIISRLKYRPYSGAVTSWAGGSWPNVRIDLATSPLDWAVASTTFANNLGPDLTTVLNGPVTVTGGSTLGAGVVVPWHIDIPLTANFVYDPTSGNDLTVDVYLDGTGWTGVSRAADFVSGTPATGAALGCRVYNTTGITATTGTITTAYAPVTEFSYVPAAGLHPNFTATPRTGPIGQLVQFSDQTYTSDPGGVTSWAWDVDGDSVTDYTTQNPSHMYTTEGNKTVTLTVTSAMFGTQSLTRTNYIVIDAVDASFTSSVLTATLVAFTDTSTGNPTTWAWDFENDGIVDSNVQHPAFFYPAPGQYTCKLTVTDAFSNDTVTQNLGIGIIPLPAFGSTFSGQLTRGFWFQSPTRFSVISARVPDETSNGTQNVAIFRLAAAPPVYATTATGGLEFVSLSQPSASPIPCAVSFDAGEFVGVLGACGTTTMQNSYATPVGPFASSVLGQSTTLTRFGTQFNINTSGPNQAYWQEPAAAISRVVLGVTACAAIPYGTGSPSGLGPVAPTMRATALPFVGQTAVHSVTQNDALVLQIMVGGFGRLAIPLP